MCRLDVWQVTPIVDQENDTVGNGYVYGNKRIRWSSVVYVRYGKNKWT